MPGKRSKPAKKRSQKRKNIHDVYEASDPDEEEKRVLAHRGGGGGSVGRTMDEMGNTLEFQINEINAEDDEEIDEDMAFNESDEERYGAFFQDSGIDEESEGHDDLDGEAVEDLDDDEEGMMDISDLIQGEQPEMEVNDSTFQNLLAKNHLESGELSELEELSESDEEDSENLSGDQDSDDEAEKKPKADLVSFIEGLDNQKASKKRKKIQIMNEAYEESEFSLPSRLKAAKVDLDDDEEEAQDLPMSSRKLQLNDMLSAIGGETSFGGLKKQIEQLEHSKAAKKAEAALQAPLPKRIQDRYLRKEAYEETKKEVSKWAPLVKKNREADHITFETDAQYLPKMTNGAMVSQFEPSTDMEKQIQSLLEESALTENKLREAEELELKKISKEELKERQNELSRMRALMFFKEQKQKKISKIKSKVYRKLHKKKKVEELDLNELRRLDPELAAKKLEEMEIERARERVTLKHKNTSKWAKQLLTRDDLDVESRRAIAAQLSKHEELKKKITGYDSDDSNQDGNDGTLELEDGLAQLEDMGKELQEDGDNEPMKGLMAMKFMKKAMEKQKAEALESLKEAQRQMQDRNSDFNSEDEEQEVEETQKSTSGRRKYGEEEEDENMGEYSSESEHEFVNEDGPLNIQSSGPVNISAIKPLEPLFKVDAFQVTEKAENAFDASVNKNIEVPKPAPTSTKVDDSSESEGVKDDQNPWLSTEVRGPLQQSQKSTKAKHANAQEKALNKLAKQTKKILDTTELDEESDEVIVDSLEETEVPVLETPSKRVVELSSSDDDSDFENNPDSFGMVNATELRKLSNKDIMKMTFENDGFADEFEEEKQKLIERDMPKEEDLTLPGWGSWGGTGVKRPKKKIVKQIPGIESEKRRDSKLKNVIINEKRPKRSLQYMVPNVPHGFENRDQYERTIRMPLGKEWNSQVIHRERTRSKVETKLGAVIAPMKFVSSNREKKSKATPRSNKKL